MNGAEFRETLKGLGLSQVGAAKFLGVNETTARRWATDRRPIPPVVAMMLRVMVAKDLMPSDVMSITQH